MTDETPNPPSSGAADTTSSPPETKWEQFERERMTRRSALRKLGMTTGMAFFSMFAVDDLARMTIKRMEEHKETRAIAETVAKEFKESGVAHAGLATLLCPSCKPTCIPRSIYYQCDNCTVYCSGQVEHEKDCTTFIVPRTATTPINTAPCIACCAGQNPGTSASAVLSFAVCSSYCH